MAREKTHKTGLDRAKSAREREKKREREKERERKRERERPHQDMQQSLAVALFFTIAFIA